MNDKSMSAQRAPGHGSDAIMPPDHVAGLSRAADALIAALDPTVQHPPEVAGAMVAVMHCNRFVRAAIAQDNGEQA